MKAEEETRSGKMLKEQSSGKQRVGGLKNTAIQVKSVDGFSDRGCNFLLGHHQTTALLQRRDNPGKVLVHLTGAESSAIHFQSLITFKNHKWIWWLPRPSKLCGPALKKKFCTTQTAEDSGIGFTLINLLVMEQRKGEKKGNMSGQGVNFDLEYNKLQ